MQQMMTDESKSTFGRFRQSRGRSADAGNINRRIGLLVRFVKMTHTEFRVQVVLHRHVPESPLHFDGSLAFPKPHHHLDRFCHSGAGITWMSSEDLHIGGNGSRSETDVQSAVRHMVEKRQPSGDM